MALTINHQSNDISATSGSVTIDGVAAGGAPAVVLEDQKASGTDGGSATSGAWSTRAINTEVRNPFSYMTVASNEFTPTVDGWVEWSSPFYKTAWTKTRLYNVTDAAIAGEGATNYLNTSYGVWVSTGGAPVSAGKTYRLEYRVSNGAATTGLGAASTQGTEVYSRVKFWRS